MDRLWFGLVWQRKGWEYGIWALYPGTDGVGTNVTFELAHELPYYDTKYNCLSPP